MEPLTAVFGALFKSLVELARAYRTQKKDLFQGHVEPLQTRLLEIHRDYLEGFRQARDILRHGRRPPAEVLSFLRDRRRDFDAERQLAEDVASEPEKARKLRVNDELWEAVATYCRSVVDYLNAGNSVAGVSWYTDLLEMVEDKTELGASLRRAPGICFA